MSQIAQHICVFVFGGGGGGGGGGTKVRDKNMFFQKPCFFVFLGCFWGVFLCSENMFSWKHVFLGDVDLEPVNGSDKHISKNILETLGGGFGGGEA